MIEVNFKQKLRKTRPNLFGDTHDDFIKSMDDLIGANIINIGFVNNIEGGLTFDYIKDGDRKRLVLGYNDLGEWIQWHDNLPTSEIEN